jgi:hypothetical protein
MSSFWSHRFPHVICLAGALLASSAVPAASQTMSFSFYQNWNVGSDGRVYVDVTAYDNSSGCSHSGYSLNVSLTGPSGGSGAGWGGMSASANLNNGDGNYGVSDDLQVTCSCMHYNPIHAGGGQTAARQAFRAVFSYRGLNGSQYEYGAVCTHSCQPSRICMAGSASYAYFNGFKIVTPALTRCQPSGVYSLSSSYSANPCAGTGAGLWTSFDDRCAN